MLKKPLASFRIVCHKQLLFQKHVQNLNTLNASTQLPTIWSRRPVTIKVFLLLCHETSGKFGWLLRETVGQDIELCKQLNEMHIRLLWIHVFFSVAFIITDYHRTLPASYMSSYEPSLSSLLNQMGYIL